MGRMRPGAAAGPRPLYVDLDGTLVATDTLWESVVAVARRAPGTLLAAPLWLGRGRAVLKRRIAERAALDPASLPYREEVVAFLRAERDRGRRLVLATAADARIAAAVAAHVELFDDVLASDGARNLKGAGKLAAIRAHSPGEFAYLGDSSADLPVWREAHETWVVDPGRRVRARLAAHRAPERVFEVSRDWLRDLAGALRPHQWAKNLLVFVPLALTPAQAGDPANQLASLLAFVALSLCASAGYVVNDLLDLEADRRHPTKRERPFARGTLSIPFGVALAAGLAAAGFGVAIVATPAAFAAWLAVYLGLALAYSLYVKRLLLLDVLLLAGLYTLRVLAGGAAVDIRLTPWLLAFSLFIFVSLAFVKRYGELRLMADRNQTRAAGRAYHVDDLDLVLTLGATSGYLSVLVLCLYINSEDVREQYARVEALWLLVPLFLYWVSRIWFLARRGALPGDPVAFAVRDPVSLVTGVATGVVLWLAMA